MNPELEAQNIAGRAMAQAMFRCTFGIVGDARFGVEGRGLGTGIGVIWQKTHLILTAAHTLQTTPDDRLYFFLPPDTLQFEDESLDPSKVVFQRRFTLPAPEVCLAENEDIAAILLPPQPNETSQNHFLRLTETDISPPVGTQVGYLGFPGVNLKPHGENFVARPYCNFGEVCPQAETGSNSTRILIRYEPGVDLDPHGLSGSGIWYSHGSSKIWTPQLTLEGLVTEYDQEAKVLEGYRVETLVHFLNTISP